MFFLNKSLNRFIGSLLVNFHYGHFYCILILRNLLHHFPNPNVSFLVEKKLILRFPLKSARGPDHSGKHTAMLHHHPNLRALRGQGPLQYDFSPTYEVFA